LEEVLPDPLPLFKALSDETRLRLVRVLAAHELNVNELVWVLEMGQSRISRHLKILAQSGLLTSRRDGLKVFYSAVDQGPGRAVIDLLDRLNEDRLGPGGTRFEADEGRAREAIEERGRAARRFFDRVAGDWEGLQKELLGGLDLTAELAARTPECRVAVDLGCGNGALLEAMEDRAQLLIGVDSSPKMIELAGQRLAGLGSRASLRIGRMEHLPLRDGEADYAVTSMALHHLARPLQGIQEAFRVLSPGGRLLMVDFEKHRTEEMRDRYGDHWLGFSLQELIGWASAAGFEVGEVIRLPAEPDSVAEEPGPKQRDRAGDGDLPAGGKPQGRKTPLGVQLIETIKR
jgi:ArsR family transcriptional regulator